MIKKKSLGQNFLHSVKALMQIVDAGDIKADDLVLEIGPGEGVLTDRLVKLAGKVIAVEKDRRLIPILQERFANEINAGKLEIIEHDILTLEIFPQDKYKVVANIPYYITGAILEKFLSAKNQPEKMVILMQKEVAERIVARDGKESILSVAVKVYGDPKIIDRVPRGAFVPSPSVDSAILLIENINRDFFKDLSAQAGCDETKFFAVLKACFGKKRAQLGRSLGEYLGDKDKALEIIQTAGLNSKIRPEDMTLSDWKNITRCII